MADTGAAPEAAAQRKNRPVGFVDSRARTEFLRMGVATFLIFFLNAQSTMLAVVLESHGMSLHDIGVLLGIFAVPVVLSTFLSGPLMARIGALATARWGMATMTIGFVSFALTAASFWPALASRMVQGAGYGLVLAPVMTYAQGRLTQERFVYLLGVFSTMAPMAQAFGPTWAEFLFLSFGDRTLFLASAIPAVGGLALTYGLRPLARPSTAQGAGFGAALRRDRVMPLVTIFVSGSMFSYLAAYMAPTLAAKGIAIGWFFTASTAAMFAARFLGFRFVEALDRRLVISGGLALMACGLLFVSAAGRHWAVSAGGITFGFGYSVVYPLVSAWMSEGLAPSERSGSQALFNAVFSIGLMGMPFPVTFVIAAAGYGAAMQALAALGLIMAAALTASRFLASRAFEEKSQHKGESEGLGSRPK
ncbi:MAG: MFS transporter [Alsobacter sp.]